MTFQKEKPLIHKIYYEQYNIIKTFLPYFINPEILRNIKSFKDIKAIEFEPENILPDDLLFVGENASKIIKKAPKDDIVEAFLAATKSGYIVTGKYMRKKLP